MTLIPERRRRKSEVNIVPLVDVLVTLIFFFLVSMQFRGQQTLNIVLPKIETAGENVFTQQLEVGINAAGQFFLNGHPMAPELLAEALQTAAKVNRDVPVVVFADEEAALKHITFVMDQCRKANFDRIRLQSR